MTPSTPAKQLTKLIDRYHRDHADKFLGVVNLLIDVRTECAKRKVSFADAWHTSGVILRERRKREKENPACTT